MQKLAIIGAGISGISSARLLKDKYEITVFEKESTPGGLIRCRRESGSLFHTCGGHVMENISVETMRMLNNVLSIDNDLLNKEKNNCVLFENGEVSRPEHHGMFKKKLSEIEGVPNPIEKHIFMFRPDIQEQIIRDLFKIKARQKNKRVPKYLATFLKAKFGDTLYNLYFKPFYEKLWQQDLKKIPLEWYVEGLNAPTPEEILMGNFQHNGSSVHSNPQYFLYPNDNGSQQIIDKLSEGLNIRCDQQVSKIARNNGKWNINGEDFDKVIFCGNVRDLPQLLDIEELEPFAYDIEHLRYHGTTSVFVEMAKNAYCTVYLPGKEHKARKIICTGNFAPSNNADPQATTGTVEFTDYISYEDIRYELALMPLSPKYLSHNYTECTHPIQDTNTRKMISDLKATLQPLGIYMTGRFADWEYYDIDSAIQAAAKTCENI